ncbi:MAG: hypothetical protein AAGI08_15235 [Bacteroidota bacterium]
MTSLLALYPTFQQAQHALIELLRHDEAAQYRLVAVDRERVYTAPAGGQFEVAYLETEDYGRVALARNGVDPYVADGRSTGARIAGSLTDHHVTPDVAFAYAEGVRRGGTLLQVQAEEADAAEIRMILARHGAIDIDERATAWRSAGWTQFDPNARAFTEAEIRAERERYDEVYAGDGVAIGNARLLDAEHGLFGERSATAEPEDRTTHPV